MIDLLTVLMDIVLFPGRVFILLVNIHRLPFEEAVLVASMTFSLIVVTRGFILSNRDAEKVLFSKLMLPALFNPVLVYLMALFSDSARKVFNNTTSYAPGLAFVSPLGVVFYVITLDFFVGYLRKANHTPVDRVILTSNTQTGFLPQYLYLLHLYIYKGKVYFYVVQWLRENILHRLCIIPPVKHIVLKHEFKVLDIFNDIETMLNGMFLGSLSGFILHDKKWYRLLIWVAAKYIYNPGDSRLEWVRKELKMTPEVERQLLNEFVEYVRNHFTVNTIYGKSYGDVMAEYARIVLTANNRFEVLDKFRAHPLFSTILKHPDFPPIQAVLPKVLEGKTSLVSQVTAEKEHVKPKTQPAVPSRMPDLSDTSAQVSISRRHRLPEE